MSEPKRQELQLTAPPNGSEPTSMLALIERIATDPSLPIERLERLLDMQERISAKQAETDFAEAMSAAQGEMARVATDADNKQTGTRYASYAQLDRALRPIYTKHGFALSFDEAESPKPEHIRVMCHVSHRGGYTRMYHRDMPIVTTGLAGKTNMTQTHGNASAQSYAMRYLLKGIFNVAIGEDDNDGNGPPAEKINEKQAAEIESLAEDVGADKAAFLAYIKVERFADIRATSYNQCVKMLEAKRNQRKGSK